MTRTSVEIFCNRVHEKIMGCEQDRIGGGGNYASILEFDDRGGRYGGKNPDASIRALIEAVKIGERCDGDFCRKFILLANSGDLLEALVTASSGRCWV
jgi:hypothetical protein